MAKKTSRKALMELDQAIDQLGGGAFPIPPPKRPRKVAASLKVAKPTRAEKTKKRAKKR